MHLRIIPREIVKKEMILPRTPAGGGGGGCHTGFLPSIASWVIEGHMQRAAPDTAGHRGIGTCGD